MMHLNLKHPLVLPGHQGNGGVGWSPEPAAGATRRVGASSASSRRHVMPRISCSATEEIGGAVSAATVEKMLTVKATVEASPAIGQMYAARGLDDIGDLLGKTLLLELVSSELDPKTGLEKERVTAFAHRTLVEGRYEAEFQVPASFGPVGAVLVENEHHRETFIREIKLVTGGDAVTFDCNSWVHSKFDNPEKRVFFTLKVIVLAVGDAQGPGGAEEEGPPDPARRRARRAQGLRARLRLRRVQRPRRPRPEPRPPAPRARRQRRVPLPAPVPHRPRPGQQGPADGAAGRARLRAPRRVVLGGEAAHLRGDDAALRAARAAPDAAADADREGAPVPALPRHRRPLQRRPPAAAGDRLRRHRHRRPAHGQDGRGHHRPRPPLRGPRNGGEGPVLVVPGRGVRAADAGGAQPGVHPAAHRVPHQEQARPGGVRPGGVRHHQGGPREADGRQPHRRGGAGGEAALHPRLPRRVPALRAQGAGAAGRDALRLPHRLLPHRPGHPHAAGHRAHAARVAGEKAAAVEAGVHARARRHRRLALEAGQGARAHPRRRLPPARQPLAAHPLLRRALHHRRQPAAQPAAPRLPPPAPALPVHHGDQRAGQGEPHQRRRHHRAGLLAGQVLHGAQLRRLRRHVAVRHGGAAQRPRQARARRAQGRRRRRAGAHHQGLPLRPRRAPGLGLHQAVGGGLRRRLLQVRRSRRRRPRAAGVLGGGAHGGARRQEGRAVVARARHPPQPGGDAHHHHVGHLRPPLRRQLRAVPLRRLLPQPPHHHPEEDAGGGEPGRRDEEVHGAAGGDAAGHAPHTDAGHHGDDHAGHPLRALPRRGVHGRARRAGVAGGAHGEGGVREVRRQDEGDRGHRRRVQQQPGAEEPLRRRDRTVRAAQALLQAGSHREGHPKQHLHLIII